MLRALGKAATVILCAFGPQYNRKPQTVFYQQVVQHAAGATDETPALWASSSAPGSSPIVAEVTTLDDYLHSVSLPAKAGDFVGKAAADFLVAFRKHV